MAGRRILSDDQLEEMAELREHGWKYQRIADHFAAQGTRISPATLHWQCLRVGADAPIGRRSKGAQLSTPYRRGKFVVRPFTPEDDALLLALELQGFNRNVIAKRMKRGHNSIIGRLMTLARRDARADEAAEARAA